MSNNYSFPFVNLPFLIGNLPLVPFYGVYKSQLVRNANVCCDDFEFNEGNLCIIVKCK